MRGSLITQNDGKFFHIKLKCVLGTIHADALVLPWEWQTADLAGHYGHVGKR